jgi:hypothetical protein
MTGRIMHILELCEAMQMLNLADTVVADIQHLQGQTRGRWCGR